MSEVGDAAPAPVVEVIEITDPCCPWCWAAEPTMRWLRRRYGSRVIWRRVIGAPIEPSLGESPGAAHARWLAAARHGGVPLVRRLQHGPPFTRTAALAVKAAERLGPGAADIVLRRMREALFLDGRPVRTHAAVAETLVGCLAVDHSRLLADLGEVGPAADALAGDAREVGAPHFSVFGLTDPPPHPGAAVAERHGARYAFPTVIVTGSGGRRIVPGSRAPETYREALESAAPELRSVPEPPPLDPDRALLRYGSLGPVDLRLLCGEARPATALPLETATVPVWLSAERTAAPWLSSVLGAPVADGRQADVGVL